MIVFESKSCCLCIVYNSYPPNVPCPFRGRCRVCGRPGFFGVLVPSRPLFLRRVVNFTWSFVFRVRGLRWSGLRRGLRHVVRECIISGVAILRGRRFALVPVVPVSPVAPVPPLSRSGSALFLSSPDFLVPVASGACPVRLVLSVFRWSVRSAVLLVLLRVSCSDAVLSAVPRPLLVKFCVVGLASLGFSGSLPGDALPFLGAFPVAPVPSFSGRCSPVSVVAGFSSVGRCLAWLGSSRGGRRGCPSACRPALAALLRVVLLFLGAR